MSTSTLRPPVLLTDGASYGTLAAARALGQEGIRVSVADPSPLAPAGWSRHAARRLAAPSSVGGAAFVQWLLAFGRREPGHVLLPTSDDTAILYSTHRDVLARHFQLAPPHPDAVMPLLDRWRLLAFAVPAGLDVPRTLLPLDGEDLLRVAAKVTYPVLLRARTQALLRGHPQDVLASTREELIPAWRAAVEDRRFSEPVASMEPRIHLPLLQCRADGAAHAYGVSGWVERSGRAVLRASWRLLQAPAQRESGVCLEHAEVDVRVASRLLALLRTVGYHGVFEAEFLAAGERLLLAGLKPRFFGHMAFDVARGLPLPQLAYLDAVGDDVARAALLSGAAAWRSAGAPVYRHRTTLELVLRARRLSGMGRAEVRRWRAWLREHRHDATDAASAPGDLVPGYVDALREIAALARHPRASLRTLGPEA